MKFKAKPRPEFLEEQEDECWLFDLMDNDGYVTGYIVDNYLVGEIIEANDEYINFEWWIPIDKETLVAVKTCDRCSNTLNDCECEYELSEG